MSELRKPDTANPPEKMGWPRALLAAGFMVIMLGVGIGAATDGSPWAKYIALAGVGTIGLAIVAAIASKIAEKVQGKPEQATSS